MKRANKLFTHLGFALLMGSLLVACGKDNKSGQNGGIGLGQFGINGLGIGQYGQIGSISNSIVAAAINENVCISSQNGIVGSSRYAVQYTLPLPQSGAGGIPAGDYYLGVTTYGDVAVLVGNGVNAGPTFVAYICSRGLMGVGGQAQQMPWNVSTLSYSNCEAKGLNASTTAEGFLLNFRSPMFGTSRGTKFSFCR